MFIVATKENIPGIQLRSDSWEFYNICPVLFKVYLLFKAPLQIELS